MADLITGFNGYLGRVRLIGLGLAHAFTQSAENKEHADFTTAMSNAIGQALMDSSRVLENIGRGPLVETDLTAVPNFIGNSEEDAKTLAADKSLRLEPKSEANDKEKGTVFSQDVRVGTEVKRNTLVGIKISLGSG